MPAVHHQRTLSARKVPKPTQKPDSHQECDQAYDDAISVYSFVSRTSFDLEEPRLRELAKNQSTRFDPVAERTHLEELRSRDRKEEVSVLFIAALSTVIIVATIVGIILQSVLLSPKHLAFPMTFLASAVFFGIQAVLGSGMLLYHGIFWASLREFFATQLGWKLMAAAIIPCSIVTAAEMALAFLALRFVSVSFFTMVKSSSIIFTLIGSFMIGQETPHLTLIGVIVITAVGVLLAAWDPSSTEGLEIFGFGLVMAAAVLNASKWLITEVLLNQSTGLKQVLRRINAQHPSSSSKDRNLLPLMSVFMLAPFTFLALILLSVVVEDGPRILFTDGIYALGTSPGLSVLVIGLAGVLMFALRLIEFRFVQLVSIITFALLGIIRQVILIAASMVFLGDILHPINVVGLLLTIIGVLTYNYYRANEGKRRDAAMGLAGEVELDSIRKARNSFEGIDSIHKARSSLEDIDSIHKARSSFEDIDELHLQQSPPTQALETNQCVENKVQP